MGDVRIIIEGPSEFASSALDHLGQIKPRLDTCEPGYGWREYGPGWTAFMRRTKTGYSAKVSAR